MKSWWVWLIRQPEIFLKPCGMKKTGTCRKFAASFWPWNQHP